MKLVAFDMGKRNFAWAIVEVTEITERFVVHSFDKKDLGTDHIFHNLHLYLQEQEAHFQDCDVILIEQQMKTNIVALKMAQHVYAFFLLRHATKTVLEYSSVHKTRVFGLGSTTKSKRKKFAIEQVHKLLESDPVMLDMLSLHQKQDDICDCILMCLAYAQKQYYYPLNSSR